MLKYYYNLVIRSSVNTIDHVLTWTAVGLLSWFSLVSSLFRPQHLTRSVAEKWSWYIFKSNPGICLEERRSTMADLTQVRRSIVRPTALFGQTNYHKKSTWCVALIFTMYLGEFAKLRKVTISFVRMDQLSSHSTDFRGIWYLSTFRKFAEALQVSLKSGKNNEYFTWRHVHLWSYPAEFFLEWDVSDKSYWENKNTRSITPPPKPCRLW